MRPAWNTGDLRPAEWGCREKSWREGRRRGRKRKVVEINESLSCFTLAASGRQGNNGSQLKKILRTGVIFEEKASNLTVCLFNVTRGIVYGFLGSKHLVYRRVCPV